LGLRGLVRGPQINTGGTNAGVPSQGVDATSWGFAGHVCMPMRILSDRFGPDELVGAAYYGEGISHYFFGSSGGIGAVSNLGLPGVQAGLALRPIPTWGATVAPFAFLGPDHTTRSIAACRHSQALMLFRRILLTSASIPDAFPPVLMDMGYEGRMHQKMHADGSAATQVFFYPSALDARGLAMPSAVPCSRPSGASATAGWMWRVQMQKSRAGHDRHAPPFQRGPRHQPHLPHRAAEQAGLLPELYRLEFRRRAERALRAGLYAGAV